MSDSMHCGDNSPHNPHTWYSPTQEHGKTVQVQHNCPGTPKELSAETTAIASIIKHVNADRR